MRAVRPIVVVETFPCGKLLLEINIVAIVDQLVELVLVGSVGPLDFAVELRRSRLDVDVFHAEVSDVPVKERLELVAAVSSDGAYPERELRDDVVDEVDGVSLGMSAVDLECANSRGIVDRRVLISPHRRALLSRQRKELHVNLHVVPGNLLLVSMGVDSPPSYTVWESVEAMPFADPIDGGVGGLDIEVALQVPHDAHRPHVVRAAQMQDLVDDPIGRLVRVVMGAAPPTLQPLVAELSISGSPEVKRRPRDAEVPAGLVDVPYALGVLEDSLLPMNLSLLVG